jgi:hypothetical protein
MRKNQLLQGVLLGVGMLAACSSPATPTSEADMAQPPTGGGGEKDMAQPPPPPGPDMTVLPTLPFAVDAVFVASGFMGDGESQGPLTIKPSTPGDSTDCNGDRPSTTAAGICHMVTYVPPDPAVKGWAGIYWQYPDGNWGTIPGYSLPSGATRVTFQAKGSKGGEVISFFVGGIINPMNPYSDTVKASVKVTLTNAWAPYVIDLTGQSYTSVLGGFGWSMAADDAKASSGVFYIDDIQWVE